MNTSLASPQDNRSLNAKTDDEWVFVGGCTNPVALPSSELPEYLAGYLKGICIFTTIGLILGGLGQLAALLIS